MIPTNFGLYCFSGLRGEDFPKFTTDRRRQTPSYSKSWFDPLVYMS